jgi:HAD superfamily hydrolase (TIGR01484 family)
MMPERQKISLVLADVDGTLLTEQKILTKRAKTAVAALREAHVRFAITSGRPPRGMAMLFDALQLDTPIAGFNGGLFVKPDLSIIEQKTLPQDIAVRMNGTDVIGRKVLATCSIARRVVVFAQPSPEKNGPA